MIDHRPFASLGSADHGWLQAHHHFSFAGYHDSARMGWGGLRVWNDDTIAPGAGFPPHGHRDMEIITYARMGAISHKDSLGNAGRTPAGEVQVMTAGRGIQHSEFNREDAETQIFQLWIEPREPGGEPYWNTRAFPKAGDGTFTVVASGYEADQSAGALPIRADGRILAATLSAGDALTHRPNPAHHLYLVADKGAYRLNSHDIASRDGVAVQGETHLRITAEQPTTLLMVETATDHLRQGR
ncbi:pirin family protein [Pacificimonas sp. WHA3]|uniref:Pirin family protein n=1 Tax=Pacificimonas pallii TaxID=2827236 RepID=A0ABS6SCL7_9SPHN|nr:pirin-like bicupin family protein [Pacificimonas pallii]MBV7255843.1 pirin family protein [Pacificimonas pallii]